MGPDSTGSDDIQRFEEHFRRNPDSLVFARLADACRKAGDPERALEILRDGIQRHPDYASAHIVRARALNDLQRPSEAEASLRRVLELDAQNLVAMRGLAGLAERRGDPVEAVHWFEQIVALDPANEEAAAALERLRESLPETPPGLEPLPAPREEWWSSPAFEIVDEQSEADIEPGGARPVEPTGEVTADAGPDAQPEAGPDVRPEERAEQVESGSESAPSRGGAWWFEDPAGDEGAEDDGDLLTRTMAELYVKQGLVDEAAAIYRELLADRPDDEDLRRALAELESDGAAGLQSGGVAEPEPESDRGGEAASKMPADESPAEPAVAHGTATAPVPSSTAEGTGSDPYATHPVPARAGESTPFREWIGRLRG